MRIVFDLDGTLVDSIGGLVAAANRLLGELDRPPIDARTYARFVGRGTRIQVAQLMEATGGVPEAGLDRTVARFMALYAERPLVGTAPYPGAAAALSALAAAGHRLGVCTQKPGAPAAAILSTLGLMPPLEALAAGDSLPGVLKPDPRLLVHAADRLGGGPLLYVGDSETDAETARRAGCPFVLTAWGYRPDDAPIAHDYRIVEFAELPRLVAGLADSRPE